MILSSNVPFDLELTLRSGQFFHWDGPSQPGKEFTLIAGKRVIVVSQISGTAVTAQVKGDRLPRQTLERILGLDTDRSIIHRAIRKDQELNPLDQSYFKLTILRQEPYECLISFITSQASNIPRVMKNLKSLRDALGRPIAGTEWSSFPSPSAIAASGEVFLRNLGFGFRSNYIVQVCEELLSTGIDLSAWENDAEDQIRNRLLQFPGVGPKVAECVLLFGYGRMGAFPIDVWVLRALESIWPGQSDWRKEHWLEWAKRRWKEAAGYVQQILFCEARQGLLS